jgi:predicted phage tail protein
MLIMIGFVFFAGLCLSYGGLRALVLEVSTVPNWNSSKETGYFGVPGGALIIAASMLVQRMPQFNVAQGWDSHTLGVIVSVFGIVICVVTGCVALFECWAKSR